MLILRRKEGEKVDIIEIIARIIGIIAAAVGAVYSYHGIFAVIGFFTTRHFPAAKKQHRYAFLIAARNEESVIANLIESIKRQDYPSELIEVFVVAHNCNDGTALAASKAGAQCYIFNDSTKRTKGFALQQLIDFIHRDYGKDTFDGYFVFDADNLLKHDFVRQMNDSFDAGEKIITSYRNIKNFNDGWVAASYGIHWLRTVRFENRARSVLRLATRIQGTGYLFSAELVKDGWKYTGLTEDRAFCADAVANGYKISYNHKAEFYDEQPVSLSVALRQRLRWAKGNLQVFYKTGGKLFCHIFYADKEAVKRFGADNVFKRLHLHFMSLDMLTVVYPHSLGVLLKNICIRLMCIAALALGAYQFVSDYVPSALNKTCELFNVALPESWTLLTLSVLISLLTRIISDICTAAYVFFMERRHIESISLWRKLWYCISFPMFDIIGKLMFLVALFARVEWKQIPHSANIDIEEIEKKHCR